MQALLGFSYFVNRSRLYFVDFLLIPAETIHNRELKNNDSKMCRQCGSTVLSVYGGTMEVFRGIRHSSHV